MKIIIVGGTGTLGQAIAKELKNENELIIASRSSGDIQVDIENETSIKAMFKQVGAFDALVFAAGKVHFGDLTEMTEANFQLGLNNKLMGQVRLVQQGLSSINDGGSFTLTSGILNHDPIRYGASAAMINGAIDGYVKSAAIEMPRGIRINVVSPTVVTESMKSYGPYFEGFESASVKRVALAYRKSIFGLQTGQCYRIW